MKKDSKKKETGKIEAEEEYKKPELTSHGKISKVIGYSSSGGGPGT